MALLGADGGGTIVGFGAITVVAIFIFGKIMVKVKGN